MHVSHTDCCIHLRDTSDVICYIVRIIAVYHCSFRHIPLWQLEWKFLREWFDSWPPLSVSHHRSIEPQTNHKTDCLLLPELEWKSVTAFVKSQDGGDWRIPETNIVGSLVSCIRSLSVSLRPPAEHRSVGRWRSSSDQSDRPCSHVWFRPPGFHRCWLPICKSVAAYFPLVFSFPQSIGCCCRWCRPRTRPGLGKLLDWRGHIGFYNLIEGPEEEQMYGVFRWPTS